MEPANSMDTATLAAMGTEALRLLIAGDIVALADRFGYALAFERQPAEAIRADLDASLDVIGATSLTTSLEPSQIKVTYYKANTANIRAVVECIAIANNGRKVLVELVLTIGGAGRRPYLEQISAET